MEGPDLSARRRIIAFSALGALFLATPGPAARAADAQAGPAYVGSATCAACHPDEAKLWAGSHHKAAMDHATDASVLGDFNNADLRAFRRHVPLHPARREVFRRDRGAGRQARRIRDQIHVRRLSAAAISDRVSRRPAAGARDRLGQPTEGQGRPALVSAPPRRADPARRRPALDQAQPELELHVRRVPLDRRAQELRREGRHVRHHVGRDQRRLRGLPRRRLAPRRMGETSSRRVEPTRKGLVVRFNERARRDWTIDRATGNPSPRAAPDAPQGGRDLRPLPRPRGPIAENWVPGRWLSDTHVVPPLSQDLYFADGQMDDEKTIITSRSNKAGCMRRA